MPYVKTLYRSLPLSTPTTNYYDWLLGRPELNAWPDYTVHVDAVTGERRRFRAVLERLEQAAAALASCPNDGGLGFAAGQPGIVGILSENCLVCSNFSSAIVALSPAIAACVKEFPILALALLKIAVPMALLPSQSTLHETKALLKLSNITFLFASEHMYPHAAAAAKEVGLPEDRIIILQGNVTGKVSLPRLIEEVKTRGLPRLPTQTVQDDTLAYLVFSSGTTGLPKGYFA
jgi:acyl-CoA synthetase (AMP-forming)/AMP-acid ligase II